LDAKYGAKHGERETGAEAAVHCMAISSSCWNGSTMLSPRWRSSWPGKEDEEHAKFQYLRLTGNVGNAGSLLMKS
jgi:hypothetical protein